jgi:hypothetical protein
LPRISGADANKMVLETPEDSDGDPIKAGRAVAFVHRSQRSSMVARPSWRDPPA